MNRFKFLFRGLLPGLLYMLLGGCQSGVYLMPTPVGLQEGKHDPFSRTPERERGSTIAVGYATNRLPSEQGDYYSRGFDQDLRMGLVHVQIGDGEQTWKEIRNLSFRGLDRRDSLLKISEVDLKSVLKAGDSLDTLLPEQRAMIDNLNMAIDQSPVKELTIYVHGANNSFYRTSAQAAQYRHFTGRQAIVTLFSWPSAESILRYGTDVSNIMETVPSFARYIKLLARHSRAEKINILSYSVGATLTTKTLAILGSVSSEPDRESYRKSLRLGSIYFAAPDTDFDNFVEEYRNYKDIVDRVTVTINENDSVLGLSQRMFHAPEGKVQNSQAVMSSKSRLGKPDISDLTEEQLNWLVAQTRSPELDVLAVDYTAIPGLSKGSHDYWYQNPWASTDALLALNLHLTPQERGLIAVKNERNARIWTFPEDYEIQVDAAIDRIKIQYPLGKSEANDAPQ